MQYCLIKSLFFVLLWIRPLVQLPLRLLSTMSLAAFAITLIVPHPVPLKAHVMMAGVGIGALLFASVYDALLDWMGEAG
jgi:hypothetical protein